LLGGGNGIWIPISDVAFIDFEIVDAKGERCPTAEKRVNFKITGPAIWRGGYDSGIVNSVDKLHLAAECGVNRVAIRSTLRAGVITLTASSACLVPAVVHIESRLNRADVVALLSAGCGSSNLFADNTSLIYRAIFLRFYFNIIQ